jgi:NADH dehydrogenase FAD-containing subunit
LTFSPGSQPKNIIIVGASFAGYHAARCLANSVPSGYRVVVIEKNTHFQLTWVLPRFCTVDGHDDKVFIPYGPYVKSPEGSCHWVRDTVEAIIPNRDYQNGGRVQLASGDVFDYAYLVLATGASAGLPSRVSQTAKENGVKAIRDQRQKLKDAQNIVVVGGGPAGIELAADAKAQFPQKNITLIHSRKTLLHEGFGVEAHRRIYQEMESLGVNLLLGEKPAIPTDEGAGELTLSGGESVRFDCLVRLVLPRKCQRY